MGSKQGGELRRLRRRKDWDQQQLADRLADLGMPIDRATISKIETGERRITLDEVFSFAVALGVSPAALVLPREAGSMVAVAPSKPVPAILAEAWLQRIIALGDYSDSLVRTMNSLKPRLDDLSAEDVVEAFRVGLDHDADRFFSEEVLDDVADAFDEWPELVSIRRDAVRAVTDAASSVLWRSRLNELRAAGAPRDEIQTMRNLERGARDALRFALEDVRDTVTLLLAKFDRKETPGEPEEETS